jgi:hypothetical protein
MLACFLIIEPKVIETSLIEKWLETMFFRAAYNNYSGFLGNRFLWQIMI